MKIVTLETLKSLPNGTVFCEIGKGGGLENDFRILTGRYEDKLGFNGEIGLYPSYASENGVFDLFDNNSEIIKDKHFAVEWCTTDSMDIDYDKNQLFAVFAKKEVEKMVKVLQWALSDFKEYFEMEEIFIGDKVIKE